MYLLYETLLFSFAELLSLPVLVPCIYWRKAFTASASLGSISPAFISK